MKKLSLSIALAICCLASPRVQAAADAPYRPEMPSIPCPTSAEQSHAGKTETANPSSKTESEQPKTQAPGTVETKRTLEGS